MIDEKLKNSLSAMADDHADELEVRRVLVNEDAEVLTTWSRYQLIGSVMRKEPIFPELNMVSNVSAATVCDDSTTVTKVNSSYKRSSFFSHLGKVAVAASVLVVTISTVYLFNNDAGLSDTATSAYAQNEFAIDDIDVATTSDLAVDQKVSELMERHDKQGALTVEEKEVENISSPNVN